jgi:ubiquinone/menaquinone biosynthesis C-methylase UbiE
MGELISEMNVRDLHASEYDRWYETAMGPLHGWVERETVKKFLDLMQEDVVLDAGCGTGRLAVEVLAPFVKKVYGLDFSGKSLEVLKGKIKDKSNFLIETFKADIREAFPIADESVDKVVSLQVIQHLSQDGVSQALANIYRVLKKGGLAVVAVYNFVSLWRLWEQVRLGKMLGREGYYADKSIFYRRYEPREIREIFESAGFKNIEVRGCINFPFYRRLRSKSLARFDINMSRFSFSERLGSLLICRGVK